MNELPELLCCILEVVGSNLCLEADCPESVCGFPQSLLKLGHDIIIPHPSEHLSPGEVMQNVTKNPYSFLGLFDPHLESPWV
jgi:hypothetical protein